MLIREKIPVFRRRVGVNRSVPIPRDLLDAYGITRGKEVVIALLEVVDHGEISKVNDLKVELLTDNDLKPN